MRISYLILFSLLGFQLSHAQNRIDSLITIFQKLDSDSIKAHVANELSYDLAFVDPDSAQYYGQEAILLAQTSSNYNELARGYLNTGVAFHVRGRFDQAISNYESSLVLRIDEHDSAGISSLYNNLGAAYTALGNYPKALEILNKSYDIKMNLGQLDKSVTTLANIGNIYFDQKKYDLALDYYKQSLEISKELQDNRGATRALNNIGLTYLKISDPEKALMFYKESMGLHDESERPCNKVHVLDGLAQAYFDLSQYKRAKKNAMTLLELSRSCEESEKETSALTLLGNISLAEGKTQEGEAYLLTAYEKAKTISFKQNLIDISFALYQHYRSVNHPVKSLAYLQEYTALKDSLQNRELIEQLTRVEMEYAFQKELDSIAFKQALSNATFQERINRKETLQYFLIIGLIVVVIFALVIYKFYQDKGQTNRLLSTQNQQITNALAEREVLMREIHHRVKNNLQVVSSLLNVQSKLSTHPDAQQALAEGRDRVLTMALIHQKLYRSENLSSINLENYLKEIAESVFESHSLADKEIELVVEIQPVQLNLDKVINIGLLVNELITNSLKHAFDAQAKGSITVRLMQESDEITLLVADDGQHSEKEASAQSYGNRLIATLARGLDASLEVITSHGTHTLIKIPTI